LTESIGFDLSLNSHPFRLRPPISPRSSCHLRWTPSPPPAGTASPEKPGYWPESATTAITEHHRHHPWTRRSSEGRGRGVAARKREEGGAAAAPSLSPAGKWKGLVLERSRGQEEPVGVIGFAGNGLHRRRFEFENSRFRTFSLLFRPLPL
jgi:hypothetical protein